METLAPEKFGDEGINNNKALLKKFIATVPERVAAQINARRKEIMAYRKKRMLWEDVLEMVEDESSDEIEEVYKAERSYSEVLKGTLVGEMKEFLDEYYKKKMIAGLVPDPMTEGQCMLLMEEEMKVRMDGEKIKGDRETEV